MEEFGVSKQSQDKIPGNSVKRQPSDLDLLFCFECDETFASKSEENRHRCGVDPNVEAIGIDDEDSINVSPSNVEDKKGVHHNFGDIFEEITGDLSENWHPPKVYNSEETLNILNISDDDEAAYEKKSKIEDSFDESTCHLTENSKEKQISDGKSSDNILSCKKDASKFDNVPTHNNETNSPKNDENAENIPPRNESSPEKASKNKKLPEMKQKTKSHKMKKEKSYQNSDILSAAVSESQIDMEDFSNFENIPRNENGMISDISDTRREYDLPHGWKKIGHRRKTGKSADGRWDFYLHTPKGKKLRSNVEVAKFLDENPDVKCDVSVTNTARPTDLPGRAKFHTASMFEPIVKISVENEKDEKKTRKIKKIKLPGQPKRNQTAYFIWMNANREEIKKESPSLNVPDIAKTAGELWKALTDKSEWEEKAVEDKKRYEAENKSWLEDGGAEAIIAQKKAEKEADFQAFKAMKRENGEKIESKPKKIKLEGQPKRAQSAFFIWMNSNRDQIKKESPSNNAPDMAKTAGELWKTMSKSEWEEKAREEKKRYEAENKLWLEDGGAEAIKAQKIATKAAKKEAKRNNTVRVPNYVGPQKSRSPVFGDFTLKEDMQYFAPQSKDSNQCPICQRVFESEATMKYHFQTVHEGVQPELVVGCSVCHINFPDNFHLQKHLESKHMQKNLDCEFCNKSGFSSKGHLELHIRSAHEPVNCSVCVKNFPNKKVLKKHMEKVHEGKSIKTEPGQAATVKTEPVTATKSIRCHICAKTFLDKRSLDRHIKIHEGIKPGKQHGCLLCGQKFIESKDLILHMESAHKTSSTNKVLQKPGPLSKRQPEFRHPCVSCEKKFLTINGLKQHMESAHPQSLQDFVPIPDVPDVKSNISGSGDQVIKKRKKPGFKHQCLSCERRFMKRTDLFQHMESAHPKSAQDSPDKNEVNSTNVPSSKLIAEL